MSLLGIDRRQGAVILTLNDPKRRNILSGDMCREMIEAVAAANADPEARAIIITGAAPAFCAGADLDDLQAAAAGDDAAVQIVYQSFMAVANSPLPTIAAVNGAAVGAGFNLALACDMRIGCKDILFDTRFLKIGLHPGGGHNWLLLRAVGWAQASLLLLSGQSLRGQEALNIGLLQALSEPEALLEGALKWVLPMTQTPRDLLLRTKASMRAATISNHQASFAHETLEQAWSLSQPAFSNLSAGLKAKLRQKNEQS